MTTSRATPRVLVADDQPDVLAALKLLLKAEGYSPETVDSPDAIVKALEGQDFDLLLMDLNYGRDTTSGEEGLDLLRRLKDVDDTIPVVVMTAWGSVELTVEAMRAGARDFIQKPWDNARLASILRTQIALGRALRKGERLERENELLRQDSPALVAESEAMKSILEVIERVGPSDANVLITGENGTGKGVVARTLHARSRRATRPLVTVNVGGLSEGVFESELFGHVKGAYTDAKTDRVGRFELADSGTLFLDEIANVPNGQQRKLLRVLETGEFERVGSSKTKRADVRVLSATNADLGQEVAEGRFRQDLLFRLNTIEIHLPPLRDRRADVEPLAKYFLAMHARHYRKPIASVDDHALRSLRDYPWPGNIRELDHAIERAVLMAQGDRIGVGDLGLRPLSDNGAPSSIEDLNLEEVERLLIQKALVRYNGNVSQAAKALGLSRSALYRRLERYRL
jgi:DNA-binding NtrC family response regulator